MKHLIKDTELVAYLEGTLSKEEVRHLKNRLKENGELALLYHLQLAYDEGMKEYANELIGEDDFYIESDDEYEKTGNFGFNRGIRMAADKNFPEEK